MLILNIKVKNSLDFKVNNYVSYIRSRQTKRSKWIKKNVFFDLSVLLEKIYQLVSRFSVKSYK